MEYRAVRSSTRVGLGAGQAALSALQAAPGLVQAAPGLVQVAPTAAKKLRQARAAERAREVEDSPRVLRDKCRQLAKVLREAKHLVVYTGAGISTAADIPDYRGPRGVWTRLQRGETVGRVEVCRARPTLTHMALTALWQRGAVKFVVSQNCDGLHLRAGLPRRALAELHGDMFAEACAQCRPPRVYLRAFDTTQRTARRRHGTRRLCHACGAELADTIVHFGERGRLPWPLNWSGALRHAAKADVILCLGSSLKVLRRYPRLWCMHRTAARRPRLYVVNLQWTPKDAVAELKINGRCDVVMAAVARRLGLHVPRYSARADPLLAHATPLAPPEAHTTTRPLLSPRALSPSPPPSDSEDEVPLRALADTLRPAPRPPPRPPPPLLCAFQVRLAGGDATILLRAEHAPPAPTSPALSPPVPPPAPLSDLRRFRMDKWARDELKVEVKVESNGYASREDDDEDKCAWDAAWRAIESDVIAADIIRRALAVCRARLYSGLHTILATPPSLPPTPPAAPLSAASPAAVRCAWCWRQCGSRRCLWYPVSGRSEATRAWRRVRGSRYLCACCPPACNSPAEGVAPPSAEADDSGWYGKGYRKGRRRKR